jgi:hypothetical protein
MASTAISICSNALQLLGDDPIASFASSEGKRARLCANLWPQVRDELLRKYPWPCTRRQVELAPEGTEPVMDWAYRFLLPADWLRTLQVGTKYSPIDYRHIGKSLYADVTVLPIEYAARIEDPTQWDSMLCDLACTYMVARLAYAVTQSNSLASEKMAEFQRALREAKSVAGQDNPPEDWGDSPFVEARY